MSSIPHLSNVEIEVAVKAAVGKTYDESHEAALGNLPGAVMDALCENVGKEIGRAVDGIRDRHIAVEGAVGNIAIKPGKPASMTVEVAGGRYTMMNLCDLAGQTVIVFGTQRGLFADAEEDESADTAPVEGAPGEPHAHPIVVDKKVVINPAPNMILTALKDISAKGEKILEAGQMIQVAEADEEKIVTTDGITVKRRSWKALGFDEAMQPAPGADVREALAEAIKANAQGDAEKGGDPATGQGDAEGADPIVPAVNGEPHAVNRPDDAGTEDFYREDAKEREVAANEAGA
ncbi:hypothetical protein K8I61_00855 [bacterium]|nr:hypothetical protein [bacterium]